MKQAILVRKDLNLPKGKLAAQVAHAAVDAVLKTDKETIAEWRAEGAKKVVLKVKDEKELRDYQKKADRAGLRTVLITDGGLTVVPPGTVTVVGIGPDEDQKIGKVVGNLKLL